MNNKVNKKERVIIKTYGYLSDKEIEDWKKDIQAYREDEDEEPLTDDQLTERIYDDISSSYSDERDNLNKTLDNNIIAIASLGLWNGRKSAYKILGNNLNEILSSFSCDEYKIIYDYNNIKFEGYHHDGTNRVLFREIRNSENINTLCNKIYANETISSSMLNYYTKPMAHYIREIYGW